MYALYSFKGTIAEFTQQIAWREEQQATIKEFGFVMEGADCNEDFHNCDGDCQHCYGTQFGC